ncbi:hypothetical protein K438DRAFT_1787398 [Mycena galopus ATCC 62051]|nr:hypothetical protein K438DRAFT_1787398 [Mycena galopus ATCC 62051]
MGVPFYVLGRDYVAPGQMIKTRLRRRHQHCAQLRLVKKMARVGQKELKKEQEQRKNERRWIYGGIAQLRSHLLKERLIAVIEGTARGSAVLPDRVIKQTRKFIKRAYGMSWPSEEDEER